VPGKEASQYWQKKEAENAEPARYAGGTSAATAISAINTGVLSSTVASRTCATVPRKDREINNGLPMPGEEVILCLSDGVPSW